MSTLAKRRKAGGIGGRLRRFRLGRNLTQVKLAELAGTSVDTINKAENGIRQPQPGTVEKLAKALEVEVERLTGGVS